MIRNVKSIARNEINNSGLNVSDKPNRRTFQARTRRELELERQADRLLASAGLKQAA